MVRLKPSPVLASVLASAILAGCQVSSNAPAAPAAGSDASASDGGLSASGGNGPVASGGGGAGNPGGATGGSSAGPGTGGSGTHFGTGGTFGTGSGGSIFTATGGASASGGSTGSGGRPAGTGGSAGSAPVSGTGGGPSAGGATGAGGGSAGGIPADGQCPANAIFCTDFESGTIPAQASFFPEYLRPTMATYLTVDSTMGFNSSRSAKFAGTSFSQMLGVATGTATFWTRVYLRSDADMSTITGHATYVAATDGNGDPNMGEQVRVGEHTCQLELNRRSDDKEVLSNGGNYVCMGGIVLAKNSWYCLETFYNGPGHEVRVFVSGTESTALHVTDWGPYSYGMFKFGFENYSSPMRTMWYDDVAIAPQRIGCH